MKEYVEPIRTKELVWKGQHIPDYYIRSDGVLFHKDRVCKSWQIKGRNYCDVLIDDHHWTYRIDYMVAYTFKGKPQDAVRLIHVNGDIADDRLENLMWYCKSDITEKYRELAIIEDDGSICEQWKPCNTEYNPDLGYEVSNFGLIRDKNKNFIPIYESHGYRVFYYLDKYFAKQTRMKAVHRAVAEAFIPNPNNYTLVNHLDGNKYNDIVVNLEWASPSMNTEHAFLQDLNRNVTYTEKQVRTACILMSTTDTPQIAISMITGIDRKTLSDIYRGRRWRHISSQYAMRERRWTPEIKEKVGQMIISGMKGKEIYAQLGIEYDQAAISLYERLRRELKGAGKF